MAAAKTLYASSRISDSVIAPEAERAGMATLDQFIETQQETDDYSLNCNGRQVPVPPTAARFLHRLAHSLAQGDAVTVASQERLLTTQEAARLLDISRPTLVRLLDAGAIPSMRVGGAKVRAHRRVRLADVLTYRAEREAEAVAGVARLIALTEELGLYPDQEPVLLEVGTVGLSTLGESSSSPRDA